MTLRGKLTARQKLNILRQAQKGKSVSSLCLKYGISRKTFYKWQKRYESSGYLKESLVEKTPARTKMSVHPRQVAQKTEQLILEIIAKQPALSIPKIVELLPKTADGKPRVSYYGVQRVLERRKISTTQLRLSFAQEFEKRQAWKSVQLPLRLSAPVRGKLSARQKFHLLSQVREGETVSLLCKKYGISRKTFYKWKNRFEKTEGREQILTLLEKTRTLPRTTNHPNKIAEALEQQILEIAAKHPSFSVPKILAELPKKSDGSPYISYYAVQRVLERNSLSTLRQRVEYAKGQEVSVSTVVVPAKVPEKIFVEKVHPGFVGVLPALKGVFAYVKTSRPRLLLTVISVGSFGFLFYSYLLMLAQAEPGTHLGLVFASIALLFGVFFFLYSLKYYIVIASVLSFSKEFPVGAKPQKETSLKERFQALTHLFRKQEGVSQGKAQPQPEGIDRVGLIADIQKEELTYYPFVSIHVATYNEKRVITRLLTACTSQDYPNYEVVIADDSTDETVDILEQWKSHPRVRISHRPTREGFKGGALRHALEKTDPRSEFVIILDADFIPYPDTITQFLKYFKASTGRLEGFQDYYDTKIAAVQGYQWHVLNKSENWITRGVRTEFAGSYVMERSGNEIFGGLKMIAGSVYMIRRDVLQAFGWGTSITEDFELTLKIYEAGYKVVYTPYIQAPSECVSTVKRLIRQRMRWAEGHSFNVKKMFARLLRTPYMNGAEKLEFLYLSPYYLQSFFFILGTIAWFISETLFHAKLPFWTSLWGWSLVFSNFLSLPLMNSVGLFLEESEEKDFLGIISFVGMSYLLVPFQAYAAIRGLLEDEEGGWFRTPKSGKITDTITRGHFYRWLRG
ncbi:MAG TPA: glycosyltransferase, partial [Patescibacteria group bacterium]|nr:glycosyltransferase [Patescibacteria group bacterium]